MRFVRVAFALSVLFAAPAARATVVIVFVNPVTLDKHTEVFNTRGPDRFLMCMQPPGTAGCTELPIRKRR